MPYLRIRDIMDALKAGGRLSAEDYVLITDLIATCLFAMPERGTDPAIEVVERKRAADRERMRKRRATSRDSRATPHTPRVNNINIKTPQTPLDAHFAEFYLAFPRRRGRGGALTAYKAAVNKGATPEELLAGAVRYAKECRGKETQFIAHPKTWLHNERWLDEPDKPQSTVVSGPWKPIEREPEGLKITEEERQANLAKLKNALKRSVKEL